MYRSKSGSTLRRAAIAQSTRSLAKKKVYEWKGVLRYRVRQTALRYKGADDRAPSWQKADHKLPLQQVSTFLYFDMTLDTSLLKASTTTCDWTAAITDEALDDMDPMNPTHPLIVAYAWVLIISLAPLSWILDVEDTTSISRFLAGNTPPSNDMCLPVYIQSPKFFKNLRSFLDNADAETLSLYDQIVVALNMRFCGAYTAAIMKNSRGRSAHWISNNLDKVASGAFFVSPHELSRDQTPAEGLRKWEAGFFPQAYPAAKDVDSHVTRSNSADWSVVSEDDGGEGDRAEEDQSLSESFVVVESQAGRSHAESSTYNGRLLSFDDALEGASIYIKVYQNHLVQQARTSFKDTSYSGGIN
jgi:hypothetical protein